jgi:hypothetical protein
MMFGTAVGFPKPIRRPRARNSCRIDLAFGSAGRAGNSCISANANFAPIAPTANAAPARKPRRAGLRPPGTHAATACGFRCSRIRICPPKSRRWRQRSPTAPPNCSPSPDRSPRRRSIFPAFGARASTCCRANSHLSAGNYGIRATKERCSSARRLPEGPALEELLRLLRKRPEIVRELPRFGPELSVFDRYEARAASRRKFAIRAFDEARARLCAAA